MNGYYGGGYYGGYGYGLSLSWTYLLVIIGIIICLIASYRMRTTFRKYSRVRSMTGMTGAQAAERILFESGIYDVRIGHVSGNLTDHYDPRSKTLNLSDTVYGSTSVAAVGVAAHECGHAIQHQKHYVPLRIRGAFVPVANFGSTISWPLIIIGLFLRGQFLVTLGIIAFSFSVIFELITLPVEFNASKRAMKNLKRMRILSSEELPMTGKVLRAAAMTYVASAASGILQLLRLIILFGGGNRR